ncbi:MAG: hypothetical protein KGJ57_17020 [Sphingomonadales bacterium]|nr:hypothetical protein [Sphingomonadales bacterium]MDE2171102.1 hypothetical protein [Sphingomonadales bacterium]
MAHELDRSLCSLPAIAAASLLLSTSPALAQTAQTAAPPVVEAPPAAAPAAPQATPQPTVDAAPSTPAPVMTSNPVVQSLPAQSADAAPHATPPPAANDTATSAAKPAQPRQTTRRTPADTKPAPSTTTAEHDSTQTRATTPPPAPADDSSPNLTRRDPAGLYTADGTPVAAPAKPVVNTRQSPLARYWPLEAGGAIILIGLVAFAATRRKDEDEVDEVETPVLAETPPAAEPEMVPEVAPAPAATLAPQPAATTKATVLPAGPVPTGAAREALLKRMVEAEPDEANPFITHKARMRRARMILAARKQALHEQATETFDWRTYKPSLTHVTLDTAGEPAPTTKAKRKTEA